MGKDQTKKEYLPGQLVLFATFPSRSSQQAAVLVAHLPASLQERFVIQSPRKSSGTKLIWMYKIIDNTSSDNVLMLPWMIFAVIVRTLPMISWWKSSS